MEQDTWGDTREELLGMCRAFLGKGEPTAAQKDVVDGILGWCSPLFGDIALDSSLSVSERLDRIGAAISRADQSSAEQSTRAPEQLQSSSAEHRYLELRRSGRSGRKALETLRAEGLKLDSNRAKALNKEVGLEQQGGNNRADANHRQGATPDRVARPNVPPTPDGAGLRGAVSSVLRPPAA